ncbi:UDP-N-acetylglucosamine 2-epimerase (hydrolyzing) [Candidatus Woesearchaeota archaeon]|nr:UDP-N-acetylglucosamine 2-epimerase (hydrolyzing) [Candidatus Woesearchaeota archaeon]
MKKIIYVTGSRAEYGVMKLLLKKLNQHPSFELSLIVTGMHLAGEFGHTLKDIENDGFKIAGIVDMERANDTNADMAKSIGRAIIGITNQLEKARPHLVILAGDRGEMLAAAIAAASINIPVAHISGGDMTTGATIDEKIRHAITKLSDIHFPATANSAKNIIEMKENPKYVFMVGNPGIPVKYSLSDERKKEIGSKYKLDLSQPILLVIQHPVTSQVEEAEVQMRETMNALENLHMQTIVVYPNSDAGSRNMIQVINEFNSLDFIQIHKNIVREDFLGLMALCSVIVGNSSCALLEAPSFGLPAVNIGVRQEGRESSSNVINVPHDKTAIASAVKKALDPEFQAVFRDASNPYAKENAEDNIIQIIKTVLPDFIGNGSERS